MCYLSKNRIPNFTPYLLFNVIFIKAVDNIKLYNRCYFFKNKLDLVKIVIQASSFLKYINVHRKDRNFQLTNVTRGGVVLVAVMDTFRSKVINSTS